MESSENKSVFLLDDGSAIHFEKVQLAQKSTYFDAFFTRWHPNLTEFRFAL